MQNFKKLWLVSSSRRKKQTIVLIILMILTSFLEVLSVGSVLPFIGALTNPEELFQQDFIQSFKSFLNLTSANQMALPLSILFIGITLLAAILRISQLYISSHLAQAMAADLSIEIYKRTLYQSYSTHISRNSSEVINGIITKTSIVCEGVISPILVLSGSIFLLIGLILMFFVIDISIAMTLLIFVGSTYLIIMYVTRRQLEKNSRTIAVQSTQMLKSLNEGLGGIREVLLNQAQKFYCKIYRDSDIPVRKAYANSDFIGGSPKYAIEAIGMILVAILAYSMTSQSTHPIGAIPILAAFALGAQRLLPALQQAYVAYTTIKRSSNSFDDVIRLLDQPLPLNINSESNLGEILFEQSIEFKEVSFKYSENSPFIFENISLKINKGDRVGIIGPTGSGKSTLLDILMGLLLPSKGSIAVDGKAIDYKNRKLWQSIISHVPQSVFLFDSTIAENIAFGVLAEDIDHQRVINVAKKAQLSKLVSSWPKKYETITGENGINLSGGQIQRIGIARALYKESKVLVFDEATSALDNETEKNVIESIEKSHNKTTILMIAHRLTTLENCNKIIELGSNSEIKIRTYDEIKNQSFGVKS